MVQWYYHAVVKSFMLSMHAVLGSWDAGHYLTCEGQLTYEEKQLSLCTSSAATDVAHCLL